jgi:tetratricopeptide (TPR) repeat protein
MVRPKVNNALSTRSNWGAIACLIALTAIAFSPALNGQFVDWDDYQNFVVNPHFRGLGLAQLRWDWTTTLLGHYVPLSWMSLGADYALWDMDPRGYHLTNIVIHIANVLLLYAVCVRLLRRLDVSGIPFVAAVAAGLFAVHPLRVESVAWVTERRDVLSLFFALVATFAYLRHVDESPGWKWYGLACLSYAAALLSKASVVTLPAVLLILNWYPLNRLGNGAASVRRVAIELVPLFAMALAASLGSIVALEPGPQLSLAQKVAVSAYSLGFYLIKSAWPARLAPLYQMPLDVRPLASVYVVSYAAVAVLAVAVWWLRKRMSGLVAGALAFLVLVLPFLGVVQNGAAIAADRYTYLAAIPLSVLAGLAIGRIERQSRLSIATIVIGTLAVLTWRQSHVWTSSETLWSRVLQVDSNSYAAHNNLGNVLSERGESELAISHFRRSIELNPHYAGPYNNLGFELAAEGELDEAIAMYEQAITVEPQFADAETNLGNALAMKGDYAGAIRHYRRSAEIAPERAGNQFNLALALVRSGRLHEARSELEKTLSIDPKMEDARALYSDVLRDLLR